MEHGAGRRERAQLGRQGRQHGFCSTQMLISPERTNGVHPYNGMWLSHELTTNLGNVTLSEATYCRIPFI